LVRQWYQPHLEQRYPDAAVRAGDLEQLQRIAGGYGSRAHFLTDLTLDPPSATSDEAGPPRLDEDYLILSTIHSAKGQEWRCVFVLNVVDGCIPSDMATGSAEEIEEERRLLYVAMTRAKDQLLLLLPQRFYVHSQARRGDRQLSELEERLGYLREREDRRATVLKSIEEEGKLTPEFGRSMNGAATKVELEDLYAPFKPKRRTKAQMAREAGLEPLADALV